MSLIPFQPREGREIVLRHRNAIVVRDTTSHRLEIRGLSTCPTCHQSLPRPGDERPFERPFEMDPESYVDPQYFRMLRAGGHQPMQERAAPSSPIRRFFQPALAHVSRPATTSAPASVIDEADGDFDDEVVVDGEAEFLSSTPGVTKGEGSRIRREAFSPNYFNTFFVEEKILGKGGKGVVLLVRHEIDGCHLGHFACKRVPVGDDHAWLEKVLIEVELLAKLSHPNLVSYRHVWLEDVQLNRFGPSVACAFILQQYCNGGDLHQYVLGGAPREVTKEELKAQMRRRSKGHGDRPDGIFGSAQQLSFEEIYSLFKDITSGVAYLHANGYIHRDLKPNNCLLHREGGKLTCLISDFGEVQAEHIVRKSTGSTGTISYCAPEVLRVDETGHFGNFTTKSDIFSLGMILYFMCFSRLPYRAANALQEELEDIDELREEIKDWQGFQHERRERPDLPSKLYALLRHLLSVNPLERPSALDVLSAMKNESNPEARERVPPPAAGLRGRRIQNLDSPMVPGSPIPDPQKQRQRHKSMTVSPDDFGTWPRSSSPVSNDGGGTALQRTQSPQMASFSRSPERYRRSSSPSAPSTATSEHHDGPFSPPLLMPPPRSTPVELRHRLGLAIGGVGAYLPSQSYHMFISVSRLGLFLGKIALLVRPCWPYLPSLEVGVPLLLIAMFDVLSPIAPSQLPQPFARAPSHGSFMEWTPLMSLGLFVMHLSVLWIAGSWSALCLSQPDAWTDW